MDIGLGAVQNRLVGRESDQHAAADTYARHGIGNLPVGVPLRHVDLVGDVVLPLERGVTVEVEAGVFLPEVERTAHRTLRAERLALADAVVVRKAVGGARPGEEAVACIRHERNHHQVVLLAGIDVSAAAGLTVPQQLAYLLPVAHQRGGIDAQHLVRVLHDLVPFHVVEVEARREGAGCRPVEVVLRHGVVVVRDQGNAGLDIGGDMLVDILQIVAHVGRVERGLGCIQIGDAQIFGGLLGVIGQAVEHRQAEVGIGAAEQRFALGGQQLDGRAEVLDGLQGGIGHADAVVVGLPGVDVAVVFGLVHVHPVAVVVESRAHAASGVVRLARIVVVVRSEFAHDDVAAAGIGRHEQLVDFLRRIQLGAVIGQLVEKIVARAERHRRREEKELEYISFFHRLQI